MCNNDSLIKHPIRKSRTKTRRPKFLSLRSELISPKFTPMIHHPPQPSPPPPTPPQKQLTLFPLHPENLQMEDREENVVFIFENDVVSSSCCSLQSFLPSYQNDMSSEEESRNLAEEAALVRTAMRSRERQTGVEEKWVCYSEVVEKTEEVEVEEVTSTAADEWVKKINKNKKKKIKKKVEMMGKQLWLKLDYEGILNAWPDKAPLFINGESPQTVPDLRDDPNLCSDSLPNRNVMDGMGSEGHNSNNNNVWKVPEMGILKKEYILGQREASVLRYKEKRQSRLFSKRIRYEVRKLNAEKRPRMKGRFVKRS
ncbi:zinc finger protein CONSTANS-LIKE 16-like [Benincasa hispida]|uniref:zinc finger protein CONSTANS-LIKE 16-like n=1 Tax=Benincasa hispida TaxID=102211 RepID=UPI0018FFFF92|nr:zinc finger protein CONSTANS-LIKE 16-like [Benincasa hispida]